VVPFVTKDENPYRGNFDAGYLSQLAAAMPHSEPDRPLVKRQKTDAGKSQPKRKQGSAIFAPYRVR
jgi:hypothetical protein